MPGFTEKGADANARDKTTPGPLWYAAASKNGLRSHLLLEHGADVNRARQRGVGPPSNIMQPISVSLGILERSSMLEPDPTFKTNEDERRWNLQPDFGWATQNAPPAREMIGNAVAFCGLLLVTIGL